MEKKFKMTTISSEFASRLSATINTWIEPFATFINDNKDELTNLSFEEIKEKLQGVLDLPKTSGLNNISNMAPSLPNLTKEPKKRSSTAKKEEASLWLSLEEYKTKDEEGESLCAYYSKRLTDHRKEKVCCAPVSETENPDHKEWRCLDHKGKPSNINTALNPKGSSKGIDKSQLLPGTNLPTGIPFGMPPLNGIGPIGAGIIPPLPPLPQKMNTPVKLSPPTPPKQVPMIPNLPPSVKEEVVKPPTPVIVKKQANINWVSNSNNTHLFSKDEELKHMLFELVKESGSVVIIGKFDYETSDTLPNNYINDLSPLNQDEQKMITEVFSLTYKEYKKANIPGLPNLPPLPTF
jgi:hypothetical protein